MASLHHTTSTFGIDENANAPVKNGGKSHLGGKTRRALGDISNQTRDIAPRNPADKIAPVTKSRVRVQRTEPEPEPDVEPMVIDECDEELFSDVEEQPVNTVPEASLDTLPIAISSIDIDDIDDPQLVAEYVDDIFRHYFEVESKNLPSPSYMEIQSDIRPDMRRVLIDWLVEVHTMFNLKSETLFLAINILDRFLASKQVMRSRLQLVGSSALFVASKYEEMYAPEVEDFVYVSDKAFNRDDVLNCESIVCNKLGFVFSCPTPFHFAQRFSKVARLNERNSHFMWYLLELALLEYSFLRYPPSVIAASAVYLTTYFDATPWDDDLIEHTRYTYASIRPCVKEMYAVLAAGKQSSVRKKYSSKNRMRVAQIGQEVVDSQIREHEAAAATQH